MASHLKIIVIFISLLAIKAFCFTVYTGINIHVEDDVAKT